MAPREPAVIAAVAAKSSEGAEKDDSSQGAELDDSLHAFDHGKRPAFTLQGKEKNTPRGPGAGSRLHPALPPQLPHHTPVQIGETVEMDGASNDIAGQNPTYLVLSTLYRL